MKNIETILAESGVEITEEQKAKILSGVKENYKTIADYEKQTAKLESVEQTLNETKEELKKFDGVKPDELNQKIADLTKAVEDKESEWQTKIAERDFNDLVDKAIAEHKGLNAVAIKSLMDMPTLKASKNQANDIAESLKKLKEADDSKMLFEAQKSGTGTPIGVVQKTGKSDEVTMHSALEDYYKN